MLYKKALLAASAMMLAFGCSACTKNGDTVIESDNPEYSLVVPGEDRASENGENTEGQEDAGPSEADKITIKLGLLKGANSIVAAHMMNGSESSSTYENYDCTIYDDDDEVVKAFESGKLTAAILPANKAAELYNATNGRVRCLAVCAKCNYYIADTNGSVKSIDSLAGQTVYLPQNDELATLMLKILLDKNGITTCNIAYKADSNELISALTGGEASVALLQEPYLSEAISKDSKINLALDLYDTWNDTTGTELATGCVVIDGDAIGGGAISYFLKDLEASVNMVKHSLDETAALAEKYGMVGSAAVAKASVPGCSISNTDGDKMRTALQELYVLLYDADNDCLAGDVPRDSFYIINGQ